MPRSKKGRDFDCQGAESEILDEQFMNYVRIANSLIPKFKYPNDVDIAERTIARCRKLHEKPNAEVKRWVQDYFKFFTKALFWTSNNQPKIYETWYPTKKENAKHWITKDKSFMAMKKLENGAVVVYIAVANDPCTGWQDEGLRELRLESCSN